MEAIHDDLVFYKRLRGEGRLGSIGRHKALIDGARSNKSQSDTPSHRPSFDLESSRPSNHAESSRRPPSQLYSVNLATTLVPSLVALSTALPPTSLSPELVSRPTQESRIASNDIGQSIPSTANETGQTKLSSSEDREQ
jgi:hypothetical protein